LNRQVTLGVIIEAILVAVVFLLYFGGSQYMVGCGLGVTQCGYYVQFGLGWFDLVLGLVMLAAILMAFLFLPPKGETKPVPPMQVAN
jgi:hypothetical protein